MIKSLLLSLTTGVLAVSPALAEKAPRQKPRPASAQKSKTTTPAPSSVGTASASHDCVRALAADPGGRFAGYPCWARAGLGVDVTSD